MCVERLRASLSLMARRCFILYLGVSVYLALKLTQFSLRNRTGPLDQAHRDQVWMQSHEREAKRIYQAIVHLQGLWIKAGQYLSTRSDFMPTPFVQEFRQLQDSLPPRPFGVIQHSVCASLRIARLSEIFKEFDEEPLATASIAQVHRAVLADYRGGHTVVVKVRHDNIEERILQDLKDLKLIIKVVAFLEPKYDFGPIVSEWTQEVPKELNFVNEANNTIEIRDSILRHNRNYEPSHPLYIDCVFSNPVASLTTSDIMVMSFIDGHRLLDVKAHLEHRVDTDEIVKQVIRAYAFQIFVIGFWNSDPHPGNFLVTQVDGRYVPALLDFGLTKRATEKEVMALSRILLSAGNMDFSSLLSGLQELGFRFSIDDPEGAMEAVRYIFRNSDDNGWATESPKPRYGKRPTQESADVHELQNQSSRESLIPNGKKAKKRFGSSWKLKRRRRRRRHQNLGLQAFPGVMVFFARVIQLLRGLSITMDSNQNYMDIMVPFAKRHIEMKLDSETALYGNLSRPSLCSPSPLDERLRAIVRDMIQTQDIIGCQICVMQDNVRVVDIAAGIQGSFDPTAVSHDSLFPVFSCTKAVAAAALHLLVQRRLVSYDDYVVTHWKTFARNLIDPSFASLKETTKIKHILNHTSGLENAGSELFAQDPFKIADWKLMIAEMERAIPASEPGTHMAYHYLSFGWLVGGIVESVTGVSFGAFLKDEILDKIGITDLGGYVGIPTGVESRLASVEWKLEELQTLLKNITGQDDQQKDSKTPASPGSKPETFQTELPTDEFTETKKHFLEEMKRMPGSVFDPQASTRFPVDESPATESPLESLEDKMGERLESIAELAEFAKQRQDRLDGSAAPVRRPLGLQQRDIRLPASVRPVTPKQPGPLIQIDIDRRYGLDIEEPTTLRRQIQPMFGFKINPMASNPAFFNHLYIRRAVIPSANGNFSARALAHFYHHLVECCQHDGRRREASTSARTRLFSRETVMKMKMGDDETGDGFGYGLRRYEFFDGDPPSPRQDASSNAGPSPKFTAFGHSGMGGSIAICCPELGVSIAIVVNKLSLVNGRVTQTLLETIGEHLGMGRPRFRGFGSDDESKHGLDTGINPLYM